jgi:hypothetical protein
MNNQKIDNLTSAICALIEALGMQAENEARIRKGEALAYQEEAFLQLIYKHHLTGY